MLHNISRFLPISLIIIAFVLFFALGLNQYISFDALQHYHQLLHHITQQHTLLALLIFFVIYVLAVTISIPGASLLTLTAGFLFGTYVGTFIVVLAATIGATFIFLATQTALGNSLRQRAKTWLPGLQNGFTKNAFSYLLMIRIIPLFPFWLINIIPALLQIRLRTYILATFLGIIPGTTVYAALGNGLNELFARGQKPQLNIIFEPYIFWPLIGLALLSTLPLFYKKIIKKSS